MVGLYVRARNAAVHGRAPRSRLELETVPPGLETAPENLILNIVFPNG